MSSPGRVRRRSLAWLGAVPDWIVALVMFVGPLAVLVAYSFGKQSALDFSISIDGSLRQYRLLLSPTGGMLRRLIAEDSHAARIAKAIRQLSTEFRNPLRVPDLARTAAMSESSFHNHFKKIRVAR